MGNHKFALLLSATMLFVVGCHGDDSKGLSPSNPPKQSSGASIDDIKIQDAQITEAKKYYHEKLIAENKKKEQLKENFYWDVPIGHDLQNYIHKKCIEYGVDERLAYAIMKKESNFDPNLISTTNDYGLFQVNQVNFGALRSKLGITNFLNPYQNALAGIYMLSNLQHEFGSYNTVLVAYNNGVGGMRELASRGEFVTQYSEDVLHNMQELKRKEVSD